ncbi:MAG: hypothetical protein LUC94_10750 [Clostridiales bacterium]|nr:hypothetical protein [Clostridiales bacterium]
MADLKTLYKERKFTELENACGEAEQAGAADWELYAYDACAKAAKSHFLRPSMEQGIALYQKALELCGEDSDKRLWCTQLFCGEVDQCARKMKDGLERVTQTEEVVSGYREGMRLCADAYLVIKDVYGGAEKERFLAAAKAAADCMVELCAVRMVEVDVGKAIVRRISHTSDELRTSYVEKFDALTWEIRALEPGYEPQEIQREGTIPADMRKAEAETVEKDADLNGELRMDSDDRFQNRFLDKLKGLFG